MVERGGVTVDWLEARGFGGGRDRMEDRGMKMEVGRRRRTEEWGRNGEDEDEEGRKKKAKKEITMITRRKVEEQVKESQNSEDTMLELRLSLAVTMSVPSPQQQQPQQQSESPSPDSKHQLHNNHSHNHYGNEHQQQQQLETGLGLRNQSPGKPLMQRPSSPSETHRDSPRPNLTASLKHLVSQQQQQQHSVKVRPLPRTPGDLATSTPQPLQQYGVSPVPQLHRPRHSQPVHSPSSLQDGLGFGGAHVRGIGRLAPSAQGAALASEASSVWVDQVGQRQQSAHLMNPIQESLVQKGVPHHNQSRFPSAQRIYLRSTSAGFPQQQSGGKDLLARQGQKQLGSLGQSRVSSFSPSSRIFAIGSYAPQISSHGLNRPVTGPQLPAFLQHQSSTSVSVASHRQTQPQACSVVRPAITGTSIGDIPPRERSGDFHVTVNVCDRKVKLTSDFDATSLYALCRRWVRSDVLRRDQSVLWDCSPLPRPSPVGADTGTNKSESAENGKDESVRVSQTELPEPIESKTDKDLLQHHVEHFKNVRQRFRDGRSKRIARFMPRLALLLPFNSENSARDADQSHP